MRMPELFPLCETSGRLDAAACLTPGIAAMWSCRLLKNRANELWGIRGKMNAIPG